MRMKIFIKRYIRYPSEFILFAIFYYIFKLLPLSVARKLGVSITTSLGPLFSINKLVKKNLELLLRIKMKNGLILKQKKYGKIWAILLLNIHISNKY